MSNLYSSRLRRIVVVIVFLIAVASLSLLSDAFTANAQTNWTLQWSDEFNGASGTGVNTSNWLYDSGTGYGCPGCPGQWGTGEVESVTNSTANVFQDGAGHLNIKPIRDGSGNWTSGRIETQRTDFQPPIGGLMRVEASLQQPNVTGSAAAGYWPAFWALGAPFRGVYTNWPSVGELDIMEDINGLSSVFGTLHCGIDPGGPCNETTGKGSGQQACSGCQTGFHTYAIEYDRSVSPEQLRWYLDGVNYFTLNASQIDATTWNNATHRGNFIILNVAMGGAFPAAFGGGPTASTQSSVPMIVDYVRVYYANGSGATATNTPSGPTNTPVPGATATPTVQPPTNTPSSSSFTQGVTVVNSTTAQIWFKPSWSSAWVDVHYNINGGLQQNFRMTNNAGTWQQNVSGLASGNVINYSFTYEKGGVGNDTGWYAYTFNGGSSPTNTPTVQPPTNTSVAPTATPTSGGTSHSNVVYVLSGGALSFNAGSGASADTISSAGGGNFESTPHSQLTYTI